MAASDSSETASDGLGLLLENIDHLGACRVISSNTNLRFPEPNLTRMLFWSGNVIEAVAPLRFIERRYRWTGSGIQNPPRISARYVDGCELNAVRHGPIYTAGTNRAFLIDLGSEIQVGERVSVDVRIQFIDEYGTFEPFLSRTAGPDLKHMSLSVTFAQPPSKCVYYFQEKLDHEWIGPVELSSEIDGEFHTFGFDEQPTRTGRHKLTWGSQV